jgi:hypothetical protein
MTFKFKSKTTGDLTMLQADGRRLLQIIGKDAGSTGIILPAQMPAAVQALETAIAAEEAEHAVAIGTAKPEGETPATAEEVSLKQRARPLIDMLRRCAEDGTEIVWSV